MAPNIDNLFLDAFRNHCASLPYAMGITLSNAFPDDVILQVEPDELNIARYAEKGNCVAHLRQAPLPQKVKTWDEKDDEIDEENRNTFYDITWKGYVLRFVKATWEAGGYDQTAQWLICRSPEIAEQFLIDITRWHENVSGEILVFENSHWHKSEELFKSIKSATFDNLILAHNLKDEILSDIRQFYEAREEYERYGIPWKRGILLYGDPGNGKTHTIKALINVLGKPCLYVKRLAACRNDNDHSMIRKVFARARKARPCLLVLEDLDSMITDTNRSFFLNELDGFTQNDGIVVIASTNHPERLDPAIVKRPSRFDRKYEFAPPSLTERKAYMDLWNRRVNIDLRLSENGIVTIATMTQGFSFAYLKELWLSSLMGWMRSKGARPMDEVMAREFGFLSEQMSSGDLNPEPRLDNDSQYLS